MSIGKILFAAAVVGVGLVVLSRSSSASPAAAPGPVPGTAPLPAGTTLKATFAPIVPSLPGLGQAYAVLKPVADNLTTPVINGLNGAIGSFGSVGPVKLGGSPYGPLTANGDGTFTNGFGDRVTPNADGTTTVTPSKNASGYEKYVGAPLSQAGTTVSHLISGLF